MTNLPWSWSWWSLGDLVHAGWLADWAQCLSIIGCLWWCFLSLVPELEETRELLVKCSIYLFKTSIFWFSKMFYSKIKVLWREDDQTTGLIFIILEPACTSCFCMHRVVQSSWLISCQLRVKLRYPNTSVSHNSPCYIAQHQSSCWLYFADSLCFRTDNNQ